MNGRDLTALGIPPGPEIGRLLQSLLDAVVDGAVPNDREVLLARAAALRDVNKP